MLHNVWQPSVSTYYTGTKKPRDGYSCFSRKSAPLLALILLLKSTIVEAPSSHELLYTSTHICVQQGWVTSKLMESMHDLNMSIKIRAPGQSLDSQPVTRTLYHHQIPWQGAWWVLNRWQKKRITQGRLGLRVTKTRGCWEGGASLLATPCLTTRTAALSVLFPLLWLSHVGSCTLCKRAQSGPASVCFLFLNSVASSNFKRGVNFTIRSIPLEIAMWQCPLQNLYLPHTMYLLLDPEEGRQGGVTLWQGGPHHKFRSHMPSFQCCAKKRTKLCPPCWPLCTQDQWKVCSETAKARAGNNYHQNFVWVLTDSISSEHL